MQVDIQNTFGAGYIGGMVAAIMYGITVLQTYLYYMHYPNEDGKRLKWLVAVIWIIDTIHISFMSHALYYYLVSSFGNEDALKITAWSLNASLGLNLCIAVLVQTYFTFRISQLSRPKVRWWLASFIMSVVMIRFAFGLETVVLMFIKKEFSALPQITLYAAMPFALTAVLSDICIAAALCVLLHGNRSPITKTNELIRTLMVYAINRCLLTSIVAVAEVIVFAASPGSSWYLAIDFAIGKLYANSFLASLNSRSFLRGRNDESTSFWFHTVDLPGLGTPGESAQK